MQAGTPVMPKAGGIMAQSHKGGRRFQNDLTRQYKKIGLLYATAKPNDLNPLQKLLFYLASFRFLHLSLP
jgi:hypothetical protein